MDLPDNMNPQAWVNRNIGSIALTKVDVQYKEITKNETNIKSKVNPRSSGETQENSGKS